LQLVVNHKLKNHIRLVAFAMYLKDLTISTTTKLSKTFWNIADI